MKNFKKYSFVFLLVLCSVLFCACGGLKDVKLDAPTSISVDQQTNIINWVGVSDADFYGVNINGRVLQTKQQQFDATSYVGKSGIYQIKVMACSIKSGYINSDYSAVVVLDKQQKLQAPVISYNSDTKTLSWQVVENAYCYTLIVNQTPFVVTQTSFNLTQSQVFSGALISGENVFSVYCTASSDYKNSDISNQISIRL
jgi:hypothetical protein